MPTRSRAPVRALKDPRRRILHLSAARRRLIILGLVVLFVVWVASMALMLFGERFGRHVAKVEQRPHLLSSSFSFDGPLDVHAIHNMKEMQYLAEEIQEKAREEHVRAERAEEQLRNAQEKLHEEEELLRKNEEELESLSVEVYVLGGLCLAVFFLLGTMLMHMKGIPIKDLRYPEKWSPFVKRSLEPVATPSIPAKALGIEAGEQAVAEVRQPVKSRESGNMPSRPSADSSQGWSWDTEAHEKSSRTASGAPALRTIPKFHPNWEEGSRLDNDMESGYALSPASNGGGQKSPRRTARSQIRAGSGGDKIKPGVEGTPGSGSEAISSLTEPSPNDSERQPVRKLSQVISQDNATSKDSVDVAQRSGGTAQAASEDASYASSRSSRRYERYKRRPAVYTVTIDGEPGDPTAL